MKQQLNKYRIQNKSYFVSHLGVHLEFLEMLNDASPASFKMFIINMSSNKIILKIYILQCRFIFFWSSGIMDFMLFTNRVPLLRQSCGISLPLMNSFNKTASAIFCFRLSFLRAFPFISLIMPEYPGIDRTNRSQLLIQVCAQLTYRQPALLPSTSDTQG